MRERGAGLLLHSDSSCRVKAGVKEARLGCGELSVTSLALQASVACVQFTPTLSFVFAALLSTPSASWQPAYHSRSTRHRR